jgi:hypothetical protein
LAFSPKFIFDLGILKDTTLKEKKLASFFLFGPLDKTFKTFVRIGYYYVPKLRALQKNLLFLNVVAKFDP